MSVAAAVEVVTGEIIDARSVVLPVGTADQTVQAMRLYQEQCARLLDDDDYQTIITKAGERRFRKKSAWRKLALAYGVDLVIISKEYERDDTGRIVRAEIVAAAIAPNGRRAESLGACELAERDFAKPGHDIPATAETRAKNRACADLFGMGEVSAEEIDDEPPPPVDEPPPVVQAVYDDDGHTVAEDHRTFLNYAIAALPENAKTWLLPVKNGDKIPSVTAPYFKVAHRDRLAWHILHAQLIHPINPPEPDADADEPVPADVHDDDTSPEAYERPPKYDPDDAAPRPGRPMP
jgi:hypothetical protein